jgi:hypothetical protein
MPPAGTATVPWAVAPGAALSFVPSANVTSCAAAPVFVNMTGYVPAAATWIAAGSNPRSNALIAISAPAATAGAIDEAAGAIDIGMCIAGSAFADAAGVETGPYVQFGAAPVVGAHAARAAITTMPTTVMTERWMQFM